MTRFPGDSSNSGTSVRGPARLDPGSQDGRIFCGPGRYRPAPPGRVSALMPAERERVDAAVGAPLETLARVPDVLHVGGAT
jgi:hypothetical protein